MSWLEIRDNCDKILQSPANVGGREIQDAIKDLENFIAEHVGTDEAAQADRYRTALQDLLKSPPKREARLVQARILVEGDPADVDKGVKILEQLLAENPEDDDVCEILLTTAQNYPVFEPAIREIVQRIAPRRMVDFQTQPSGSEPPSPENSQKKAPLTDLKKRAEDAYYSGQWDLATALMQQMLEQDPYHAWALEHIEKARVNRTAADIDARIPGQAKQLYRRARSFIIARQYDDASNLLKQAMAIAEKSGVPFSRADELLESMEQVFAAQEFKTKLKQSLQSGKLTEDVFNFLDAAKRLDETDENLISVEKQIKELESIQRQIKQLSVNEQEFIHGVQDAENGPFEKINEKFNNFRNGNVHPWIEKSVADLHDLFRKECEKVSVEMEKQGRNHKSNFMGINDLEAAIQTAKKALTCYRRAGKINNSESDLQQEIIVIESFLNALESLRESLDKIKKLNNIPLEQIAKALESILLRQTSQTLNYSNYRQAQDVVRKLLSGTYSKAKEDWEQASNVKFLYSSIAKRIIDNLDNVIKIVDSRKEYEWEINKIQSLREQIKDENKKYLTMGYRLLSVFMIVALLIFIPMLYSFAGRTFGPNMLPLVFPSHTPTFAPTLTPTLTITPTLTVTLTSTITPLATFTKTPLPASSPTITMSPTPARLVYITALIYFYSEFDAQQSAGSVPQGTTAMLLEARQKNTTIWYLIQWEKGDSIVRGWVRSSDYVKLLATPQP